MNEPTSSNWTRGSTFSVFKFAGRPTHRWGLKPQLSFAKSELSRLGFIFKVFKVGSPPRLAAGQNGREALRPENVGSESF